MPRISEMLRRPTNEDGSEKQWSIEEPLSSLRHYLGRGDNLPAEPMPPSANPIIRCPMPATGNANPDSLRQFYKNNVAQFRVLTKS